MGRRNSKSRTEDVGSICELMFASIAHSLGCAAFFPVGTSNVDIMLTTATHRKLAVQIKGQSTADFSTVDLKSNKHDPLDVIAIFNENAGGWFLVPAKKAKGKRTLSARMVKKYLGNWDILK